MADEHEHHLNIESDPERFQAAVADLMRVLAAWPETDDPAEEARHHRLTLDELSSIVTRILNGPDLPGALADELYAFASVAWIFLTMARLYGEIDGQRLAEVDPLTLHQIGEDHIRRRIDEGRTE